MALTSRKMRPLDRSVGHLRDTRLVVIAAEGKLTEKQYFGLFRSPRIQVKVLATGDRGDSAPEYVLGRLVDFREDYQIGSEDELWLMVDVDRWGKGKLVSITKEARQRGIGLALSNPCFEVWLLFHFTHDVPNSDRCDEIERALRRELGGSYNKRKLRQSDFDGRIQQALERSRAADCDPNGLWPKRPGTHVYRLVINLRDILTPT